MKKNVYIIILMLIPCTFLLGCVEKVEPNNLKEKKQSASKAAVVKGRILYGWKGFKEKPYGQRSGVCLLDDGQINKYPDISSATWVAEGIALASKKNPDQNRSFDTLLKMKGSSGEVVDDFNIPLGIGRFTQLSEENLLLVQLSESEDRKYTSNLAILNTRTNELKKITKFPLGERWSIHGYDVSQDGSKIAYSFGRTNELKRKISIIDLDGNLVDSLSAGGLSVKSPKWSKDGKKIVLTASYPDEQTGLNDIEIALYDLATEEIVRLTQHKGIAASPDFSPDGKQIVYVLWGEGGRANNLAVINIDGSGFQTLLPEDHVRQGQISNPDWGE